MVLEARNHLLLCRLMASSVTSLIPLATILYPVRPRGRVTLQLLTSKVRMGYCWTLELELLIHPSTGPIMATRGGHSQLILTMYSILASIMALGHGSLIPSRLPRAMPLPSMRLLLLPLR